MVVGTVLLPALLHGAGEKARWRFMEFFAARLCSCVVVLTGYRRLCAAFLLAMRSPTIGAIIGMGTSSRIATNPWYVRKRDILPMSQVRATLAHQLVADFGLPLAEVALQPGVTSSAIYKV